MKIKVLFLFYLLILFSERINAQGNQNIENILSQTQWNSLFPKRAGTFGVHPQGYTSDFYSFNNFKQAVQDMSDYLVEIRKKQGVWGELITITKKSKSDSIFFSKSRGISFTIMVSAVC